jgi:hypothetical protein
MAKAEEYRIKLISLTEWDAYLLEESGLPGPRGNIELAQAVADEGSREHFERYLEYTAEIAPENSPYEFLFTNLYTGKPIKWAIGLFCLSACWMLFTAARRAKSEVEKRHYTYVAAGMTVITFAIVKVGVVLGINLPILLLLGMLLVDRFNAMIGIAILMPVKNRIEKGVEGYFAQRKLEF